MTILSGDIKFFASKVMADVPEGGGGPTGTVIADGVSNAIFPDVSELDRAMGRVKIRQVVLGVQTPNTDTYMGANVIVAEPPNDPNVSVVIVKVDDLFATRDDIKNRIESYLAGGSSYPGYLFGDMLTGQKSITIAQREGVPLPNIGDRLVLRKWDGQPGAVEQFVAVTSVSSLLRTFSDPQGDFVRNIVALGTSERLEADFPGFDATRIEPATTDTLMRTGLYEAVVANAASYYGAVPLAVAASIGDFTVQASTIRAALVPSAQAETPIADASTNGMAYALVAAGGPVAQTINALWTPTQPLYIGGSQLPGSVSIERDGLTVTDSGGRLLQAGTEVGAIDYDNGIATLSTAIFGSSAGWHTITGTPAALPQAAQRSVGIPITLANRSLNYVRTLVPPARCSLLAHYMVGGQWYTLREDGSGALRGIYPDYGVGNLNRSTGTLQLTLGALPDVGSAVILQWTEDTTAPVVPNAALRMPGKLFAPINTAGAVSDTPGPRAFLPGAVKITWNDGADKSAADDGNGGITGDATGIVDYQRGVAFIAPSVLPPVDTVFLIKQESTPGVAAQGAVAVTKIDLVWSGYHAGATASIGAPVAAGSLSFQIFLSANFDPTGLTGHLGLTAINNSSGQGVSQRWATVTDDRAGNLVSDGQSVGTLDYSTGALGLDPSLFTVALSAGAGEKMVANFASDGTGVAVVGPLGSISGAGFTLDLDSATFLQNGTVIYTPGSASTSPIDPVSAMVDRFMSKVSHMAQGYTLQGVSFALDGHRYVGTNSGVLITDIDPSSGAGTPVGTVGAALGTVELNTWPDGIANTLTDWRAVQAPPSSGTDDLSANTRVLFRTASAPLRPGSLSVIGEMQDGTPINVVADVDGHINGTRVKGVINAEFGVCELVFCNPSTTSLGTTDLSYMGIAGVGVINIDTARTSTLRYNAVAYSYIPLDASITGINSVRLPSDGKVSVVRTGYVGVLGHTGKVGPQTVSNGQTIDCARVRISRVAVVGDDGLQITSGFTSDLEAGKVSFTDVSGYSQPVTVEHRIEDTALVADAQINGAIRLTRALTHDYPVPGSYFSSALLLGDMFARVSLQFDQYTWDGISWADVVDGDAATGTYNDALAPIEVTNDGAITERWAQQFTSSTAFRIVGEHVGVIGTGSINADCSPINPNTGSPYFTIRAAGWGSGWEPGNVMRHNTVGALRSVPLVQTIAQGPEAGMDYHFSLLGRGDVDRP